MINPEYFIEEAYQEGRKAFSEGVPAEANPYWEGFAKGDFYDEGAEGQCRSWGAGWAAAAEKDKG